MRDRPITQGHNHARKPTRAIEKESSRLTQSIDSSFKAGTMKADLKPPGMEVEWEEVAIAWSSKRIQRRYFSVDEQPNKLYGCRAWREAGRRVW